MNPARSRSGLRRPGSGREEAGAGAATLPRLHLIAGDEIVGRRGGWARLLGALEAGGSSLAVHLRARRTPARRIHEVAERLAAAAAAHGALTLVNDRVDVALAAGASGVHLREDSIPPEDARRLWDGLAAGESRARRTSPSPGEFRPRLDGPGCGPDGPGCGPGLVGRSIHLPAQVAEFEAGSVDYFVLGAVYDTASHPGRPPLGLGALAAAAERSAVPVVAIGGITPERTASVVAAGARGVAVASGAWSARDPAEAVKRYLDAFAAGASS